MRAHHQPHVAVFFGGTAANHDLSTETAQWVCHFFPRSKYRVIPVHITPEGLWQVPLGTLPKFGSVARLLDSIWQAVPAVPAKAGIERLLSRPVDSLMTVVRGEGGDDGGLHMLAKTLGLPMVGSSAATCQRTSHKYVLNTSVEDIISTPFTRHYQAKTPAATVIADAQAALVPPFFLKPVSEEGSVGIEELPSFDALTKTLTERPPRHDFILQERAYGPEIVVTLFENDRGVHALPSFQVQPLKGTFYDDLAKRRAGRTELRVLDSADARIKHATETARALYDELGGRDLMSFDMVLGDHGPELLEVNTIPSFTAHTPLQMQFERGALSPTTFLDRSVKRSLERSNH